MNKYVELLKYDVVVKRLNVSQLSENGVDLIETSFINDYDKNIYSTRRVKCGDELETGWLKT
jgi:hypothetical protein